jgi:hypothetical protein
MDPLTIAGLGTGANLLGSLIGGLGASSVAEQEARARQAMMERQIQEGKQAYSDIAPTYQPYMDAGQAGIEGLGRLGASAGAYDYAPEQFQYEGQVSDFLDPSNEYASQQAQRALQSAQASQGGLLGGGALKELNAQQFNMGQQGWQNALNNMRQDSNTKYGRFLDFGNQTSNALQNSFNNRFQVANQQTGLGRFGTSGNASARMNVAQGAQNAIGNQIGPQAGLAGSQAGAPYAMGQGVVNSVFNKDNFQALGQAFPQGQEGYTSTQNTFQPQYQQPQNAGNFGMNASYGQQGYMNQNPRVSQGNINVGGF